MDIEKHTERHKELHKYLDELVADFILCSGKRPSDVNLLEFMHWSHDQTIMPDDPESHQCRRARLKMHERAWKP